MLSEKEYKELAFSILVSSDPILTMLEAERDHLNEHADLWQKISRVMDKVKHDKRLAEMQPSRFISILATIEVFNKSKWERDEKIPPELFKMAHISFFLPFGNEILNPENKILVRLSHEFTISVMEELRPFEPSKEEFDFFKNSFHGRFPAREYCDELDNGTSGTLEKIFQRPKDLRPELREYYFTKIKADIIDYLSKRKDRQIDFQLAFDERMKAENEPRSIARPNSGIRLNRDKLGAKTELLRILDALYDLHFFINEEGQLPNKEFVMKAFGEFLGNDFSSFANVLSQSYNITSLEANLSIFEQLKAKTQSKCLQKT